MADDNLLATLEQSLRQTRATRNRLSARLADLELEAEKLRTEISEMDAIASQTQAAMYRILSSVLTRTPAAQPSDTEIEFALRRVADRQVEGSGGDFTEASVAVEGDGD